MPTPNQQLVDIVCNALIEAGVTNEKEITSLRSRILAGKVKAEDWNLAVENSLLQVMEVPTNGD